ncbi:MAG: 50S ribosomal protein L29 [Firmicutes bacterium]|nr:50S ribosomal protein L29 [Bacillota bacterium]
MNRAEHYHQMTTAELKQEYTNKKQELFNLRFQHSVGQLKNPLMLNTVKKDTARILTIIKEREYGIEKNKGKVKEVKKATKPAKKEEGAK